jgi:amino acid transporter
MSAKPKQTLPRELNLWALVFLTVSAITPASSMFIEMPGALQAAGTSILIVLVLSGLVGLVMALVYSELSSAFPTCGGEYVIVGEVLGAPYAYVVMILNAAVMIFIPAVLGLGAGQYFSLVLPEIPPIYVAVIVIAISTLFAILRVKLNAWVTSGFLLIELGCLFYFSYVATTHVVQPFSIFLPAGSFVSLQDIKLAAATFPLIATSVAIVIFAFNGYEQAIYLSENTHAPRKTVPRAIIISLFFGLLLEGYPTVVLLLSSTDIQATLSSTSPYLDYLNMVVGGKAQLFMALGISVAVLNACIVNILMTARFLFSIARDGYVGTLLGRHVGKVYESQGAPLVATLIVGILGGLACKFSIAFLTVLTGTGLVFIYFLLCICVIVGRRNKTTDRAEFKPRWNRGVAIFGMVALCLVVIANWLDPTTGRSSVIWALAEGAGGLMLYVVARVFGQKIKHEIPEH